MPIRAMALPDEAPSLMQRLRRSYGVAAAQ
jgi:hypothetical protein